MSIPPSNPPPYGTPPYGAPPARSSGGGNGWKIAGFGCLGLFLLAAIGGVILVRNVKNSITHPSKNSIFGVGVIAGKAGLDGAHLQQAIVAYHAKHGAYPPSLTDLYTEGSIDGKQPHNALPENPTPAPFSCPHHPPAEGAPGDTPILEEDYHITFSGSTAPGRIIIDLNGKSQSGPSQQSSPSSGPDQGSSGQ